MDNKNSTEEFLEHKYINETNQDLIEMRKEYFNLCKDFLFKFYEKEVVDMALNVFIYTPSLTRIKKSPIGCLIECCEDSKKWKNL